VAVIKRGNVWQVQVRVGKDPSTGKWVRRAATCSTMAEAKRVERKLLVEAEQLRARWVEPASITLSDYLVQWKAEKDAELRISTQANYNFMITKYIVPKLGHVPLRDLSPTRIQQWINGMNACIAAESARAVLQSALKDAVVKGLIPDNPVNRTKPRPRPKTKRKSVEIADAQCLFTVTDQYSIGPLVRFLYYTGLRIGEALGLKWDDVSWDPPGVVVRRQLTRGEHGRLYVQDDPKTEAGRREVPLVPQAVAALKAQQQKIEADKKRSGAAWRDENWIFPCRHGSMWNPVNIRYRFRLCRAAVGLTDAVPHALRHSTASLLLGAGVEPAIAAKIMGHKSLAVFYTTYADLLKPAAQEAARQLSTFLDKAEPAAWSAAQGRAQQAMSANVSAKSRRRGGKP